MAKAYTKRPAQPYRRADQKIIGRLRRTVGNGRAVKIPLNGEELAVVRSRYGQHLWTRYRLRMSSKKVGSHILGWAQREA